MTAPSRFDVCGPLPSGVTVLEASAGTGKTFTIAALAARYVADGVPLENLLLVTFTRMATGELRERVRERLARAVHHLSVPGRAAGTDAVLDLLASGAPAEVELRRRRLARALADFDAATIATIHGFCQHILAGMGVAGDVERDVVFVDDVHDLVDEVVDDLYVRRFARSADLPAFDRTEALRIGHIAVENARAPIEPSAAPPNSPDAMRQRLALAVREEVERRKRRAKVITYDDLLHRLDETLRDPVRGADARERLRRRYQVALVDEFQDTDPVQWSILRQAFADGAAATLVLIGDPKQAIYAFRGADVHAYLDAAAQARSTSSLGTNWRSDAALIRAYDQVFGNARLGHEGIAYLQVAAAPAHQTPRLQGAGGGEALRVRVLLSADVGPERWTPKGYVRKDAARALVAADVAADIVALLESSAEVVARRDDGTELRRDAVRPDHIAVLVRTNRDAATVRNALDAVGVPAVINGAGSVFGTPVAREWLRLLAGLERPAVPLFARAAALTPFLGWSAADVAAADDDAWEEVHARLHTWAGVLRQRGVAALLELINRAERLPGRLLARSGGERELTDLRHVGQLLHAEAVASRMGVTALTAWLRQRIAEADDDIGSEDRSRRLESDARAVQVLTIHRSKGLQFPVVYCPYLWDPSPIDERRSIPVFHAAGERRIDVGRDHDGRPASWDAYVDEERGEDLRLAYVALTRAQHRAVVWWTRTWDARLSPLGRLVFGRADDGNVATALSEPPHDLEAVARFRALAADAAGAIAIERAAVPAGTDRWQPAPSHPAKLEVRTLGRGLDVTWRRTSYTDLTAGSHDARVASEPEATGITDEVAVDTAASPGAPPLSGDEARLRAVPSPLAGMARGAEVGSFVHAVLEAADWAAADRAAELSARVTAEQRSRFLELGPVTDVVAGLRAVVETPLGPLVDDLRLCDVTRRDRVEELWFELPLVGGDHPTAALTLPTVAAVLHRGLAPDDLLAGYPALLAAPALAHRASEEPAGRQTAPDAGESSLGDLDRDLRGYLTGSIDAVVRVRRDGDERFVIVDHKTNWLGPDGEDLSAWHYRPSVLVTAMQEAHYPLQALLYSVALHRYLRWRVRGYDPQRHLGGVLYLFLRGMTGADVPRVDGQPCGVFAWHPPAELIVGLSELFDRGEKLVAA